MARGIGGDDGPTLWMFVACILIWGKVQGWFSAAGDALGGNLANPLQDETTDQIRAKEKRVKDVKYKPTNLPKVLGFYEQIADDQYSEMLNWFNVDEDKLINQVKSLNKDELTAVYKSFGVRDNKVLGVAQSTMNLLEFYQKLLTDSTFGGDDLTTMRKIWAKTGLWAGN